MAASSSQVGSGDRPVPVEEIFNLLESTDVAIADDVHRLILENLSTSKESWLINTLVDYFFNTRSLKAQALLTEVREPLDKALIEKIQDGLRSADTRLQAMQLLLFLVYQQPPWTHSIVSRPIFATLLKILKAETDVPILMTAILVVVILLPVVPVGIEPHLPDVLEVFARVTGLLVKKPANCPDIFILHLHVAVYAFFLRLYGMFPCTFVSFLRINYAKKENLHTYNEIIVPMMERLRLHPNLVTGSRDTETSRARWQRVEPQDVVVSCAKMSLDVIEGICEDLRCPLISSILPRPTRRREHADNVQLEEKSWQEKLDVVDHIFPVVEDPAAMVFSPSQLIGLGTPPTSERATPAIACDLTVNTYSPSGVVSATHQVVTPTPELTPADTSATPEEPDKSIAGHGTKSASNLHRSSLKATPVTLDRMQGSSAFVSPCSVRAPPPTQAPSVEPSPMRPHAEAVAPSPFLIYECVAARALQFDRPPEVKGEARPKDVDQVDVKPVQEAAEQKELREAVDVPAPGPAAVDSVLTAQDLDPLDQEVSHITEAEDQFDSSTSVDSADDVSTIDPQQHMTAQSIVQFMKKVNRIRFNSLSTQAGEPVTGLPEKYPRPGRARSCPPLPRQQPTIPEQASCRSMSSSSSFSTSSTSVASSVVNTKMDAAALSGVSVPCGEAQVSEVSSVARSHTGSRHSRGAQDGSPSAQSSTHVHQRRTPSGSSIPSAVREFSAFFQTFLAPVKVAVCERCHQIFLEAGVPEEIGQLVCDGKIKPLGTWLRCFGSETSFFSSLSPPELLDRHLSRSSDLHAKQLARIPLTSGDSVSWTHFGGMPPADEINILRGQMLLLHNQLMYERHKRNNHAMRNRRLLRRIAHATTLEEHVQSLTSQLQNSQKEIQNLQVSLKLLQDHNHRLEQKQESDEYEKLVAFRTTIQQNKDLTEGNLELKNLLLVQKAENDELKKELQQVRAAMFQLEKSHDILQKKLQEAAKWREQVLQLQKEVLLMGEAQEHLQERLQQQRAHQVCVTPQSHLVQALQAETADVKKQLGQAMPMVEALQVKVITMEDTIKSKDIAIAEMKNTFQNTKVMYANEIQAVNDKYRAMLHINTQLEAQLLQQYADNDRLKYRLSDFDVGAKALRRRETKSPMAGKDMTDAGELIKAQSQLNKPLSTEDSGKAEGQKCRKDEKEVSGKDTSCSVISSFENTRSTHCGQTGKMPASCDGNLRPAVVPETENTGLSPLHQTSCGSDGPSSTAAVVDMCSVPSSLGNRAQLGADTTVPSGGMLTMIHAEPDRGSFSYNSDITSDSGIFSKGDPVS